MLAATSPVTVCGLVSAGEGCPGVGSFPVPEVVGRDGLAAVVGRGRPGCRELFFAVGDGRGGWCSGGGVDVACDAVVDGEGAAPVAECRDVGEPRRHFPERLDRVPSVRVGVVVIEIGAREHELVPADIERERPVVENAADEVGAGCGADVRGVVGQPESRLGEVVGCEYADECDVAGASPVDECGGEWAGCVDAVGGGAPPDGGGVDDVWCVEGDGRRGQRSYLVIRCLAACPPRRAGSSSPRTGRSRTRRPPQPSSTPPSQRSRRRREA